MDIEELYRCVFNNVSKNQYDKAFEIALSAYQSYTLNENLHQCIIWLVFQGVEALI